MVLHTTGYSASELARKASLSTTTLTRFMNSEDHQYTLSGKTIAKIADATGIAFEGEVAPAPEIIVEKAEEFATIPIYDIRASAGPGAMAEDGEPIGYQPYRQQELDRLTRTAEDNLAVIRVAGDSMEPALSNADQVLVDRSVRKVGRDGIYIIALEDDLLVKRCQVDLQTRHIIVKSDNPAYETMTVTDAERVEVLGRVIWIGRALG